MDINIHSLLNVSVSTVGWAQLMDEEMKGWAPIGVVGAIVPWNFPLMLLTWKVSHLMFV